MDEDVLRISSLFRIWNKKHTLIVIYDRKIDHL